MHAHLLLHGTGVRAGGALVTRGPVRTGLGALTGPTHTLAPPTAQQTQVGHAGVSTSGAVTVLALPVRCTLAETTVTDTMAWEGRRDRDNKGTKEAITTKIFMLPTFAHLCSVKLLQ